MACEHSGSHSLRLSPRTHTARASCTCACVVCVGTAGLTRSASPPSCSPHPTTSQCGDFVKNELADAVSGLGADFRKVMNLTLVPFGNAIGPLSPPPVWDCQHGNNECIGNRWEQCAISHYPTNHFPFFLCMEKCGGPCQEQGAFTKLAKKCAASSNLNFTTLSTCFDGPESQQLQQRFHDLTPADHQYTPWVVVDGTMLSDTDAFKKTLCAAFKGTAPAYCARETLVPAVLNHVKPPAISNAVDPCTAAHPDGPVECEALPYGNCTWCYCLDMKPHTPPCQTGPGICLTKPGPSYADGYNCDKRVRGNASIRGDSAATANTATSTAGGNATAALVR